MRADTTTTAPWKPGATELGEFLRQTGVRLGPQRDRAELLETHPLLLAPVDPRP